VIMPPRPSQGDWVFIVMLNHHRPIVNAF